MAPFYHSIIIAGVAFILMIIFIIQSYIAFKVTDCEMDWKSMYLSLTCLSTAIACFVTFLYQSITATKFLWLIK